MLGLIQEEYSSKALSFVGVLSSVKFYNWMNKNLWSNLRLDD